MLNILENINNKKMGQKRKLFIKILAQQDIWTCKTPNPQASYYTCQNIKYKYHHFWALNPLCSGRGTSANSEDPNGISSVSTLFAKAKTNLGT